VPAQYRQIKGRRMRLPPRRDLEQYYRKRAWSYEQRDTSSRSMDVSRLRSLCQCLLRGRDVLEIACGTGIWTLQASTVARSVFATDLNENMLCLAKSRLRGRANVVFRQMDAFDAKHLGCRFDAGLAAWWISHVPKSRLPEFFESFHRALLPGAIAVLMDDTEGTMDVTSSTDDDGNSYTIRALPDGTEYEIIKNPFDERGVRELLGAVASDISLRSFSYHWLLSYTLSLPGGAG
jgi:ubiquinone/menaquinone biosynthesis C-methylase UbiE